MAAIRYSVRRKVWSVLFVAALQLVFASVVFAQAVLNPNKIVGTFSLTNTNPEILNVLDPAGLNQGIRTLWVYGETKSLPILKSSVSASPLDYRTSPYQMVAESSVDGVQYVMKFLPSTNAGDLIMYDPEPAAVTLYSEPSPPARFDVQKCLAAVHVRFVDVNGVPVAVDGGSIYASEQKASPETGWISRTQANSLKAGISDRYVLIPPAATNIKVHVEYQRGTDYYTDRIRYGCDMITTLSCDQVVNYDCVVPQPGDLGTVTGRLSIAGEELLDTPNYTKIEMWGGPFNNGRYFKFNGSPSSGNYLLPNLVPSQTAPYNQPYAIRATMLFRQGYRMNFYQSAVPTVFIEAGTNDLGNLLEIVPAKQTGEILLTGPRTTNRPSCISRLLRDADRDSNSDGIPDSSGVFYSYAEARGVNMRAPGSNYSGWAAAARASFPMTYDPAAAEVHGDYELVYGGLASQPSIWDNKYFNLTFGSQLTDPVDFFQGSYSITDLVTPRQEVRASENYSYDHRYCFSELRVRFRALSSVGAFHSPTLGGSARYTGTDFLGRSVDYGVPNLIGDGTPFASSPSTTGLVVMCLPQGTYTFNPSVWTGGFRNKVTLSPITVNVGCRQTIDLSTQLSINLDQLPISTMNPSQILSGAIASDGNVISANYSLNGGQPVTICTNCGQDPTFSNGISLTRGPNTIVVNAEDEFGNKASVDALIELLAAPTATSTPLPTSTSVPTLTPTAVPTSTATSTSTFTPTPTVTKSATSTNTAVPTSTRTPVPSPTATDTATSIPTAVPTATETHAPTVTPTFTPTFTRTARPTSSPTILPTHTAAPTLRPTDPPKEVPTAAPTPPATSTPRVCAKEDIIPAVNCSVGTPLLWPDNHKFFDIGFSKSAINRCREAGVEVPDSPITVSVTVWSDETEVPQPGDGSGTTAPDAMDLNTSLKLRSERRGTEDGRVYLIVSEALNRAGNRGVACCTVVVPHSSSAADKADVARQADAARAFCLEGNGAVPRAFTQHGVSASLSERQIKSLSAAQAKADSARKAKSKQRKTKIGLKRASLR